jgi:hypothetical protein
MAIDRALERAKLLCIKAGLNPEGLQRFEGEEGPCFLTADCRHGLTPGLDEFLKMSEEFVSMKMLINQELPQSGYTVRTNDAFEFDRRAPTLSHAVDGTVDVSQVKNLARMFEGLSFGRSAPTAIGHEHGSRDRYGNVLLNPAPCPTCGREDPEPEFTEPGNRRMVRSEWLVWYALKHDLGLTHAWEAAAKKVIENEFGEKTRWRVTAYRDPHDPRLVRIKYNDE